MEKALNNKEDNNLTSYCHYLSLATSLLVFWSHKIAEDARMEPPYRSNTLESMQTSQGILATAGLRYPIDINRVHY